MAADSAVRRARTTPLPEMGRRPAPRLRRRSRVWSRRAGPCGDSPPSTRGAGRADVGSHACCGGRCRSQVLLPTSQSRPRQRSASVMNIPPSCRPASGAVYDQPSAPTPPAGTAGGSPASSASSMISDEPVEAEPTLPSCRPKSPSVRWRRSAGAPSVGRPRRSSLPPRGRSPLRVTVVPSRTSTPAASQRLTTATRSGTASTPPVQRTTRTRNGPRRSMQPKLRTQQGRLDARGGEQRLGSQEAPLLPVVRCPEPRFPFLVWHSSNVSPACSRIWSLRLGRC